MCCTIELITHLFRRKMQITNKHRAVAEHWRSPSVAYAEFERAKFHYPKTRVPQELLSPLFFGPSSRRVPQPSHTLLRAHSLNWNTRPHVAIESISNWTFDDFDEFILSENERKRECYWLFYMSFSVQPRSFGRLIDAMRWAIKLPI